MENVLNPPQNPVRIKKRKVVFEKNLSLKKPMDIARTAQLKKFASKVPSGNCVLKKCKDIFPTANRASEPSPPPMKMANKLFK